MCDEDLRRLLGLGENAAVREVGARIDALVLSSPFCKYCYLFDLVPSGISVAGFATSMLIGLAIVHCCSIEKETTLSQPGCPQRCRGFLASPGTAWRDANICLILATRNGMQGHDAANIARANRG